MGMAAVRVAGDGPGLHQRARGHPGAGGRRLRDGGGRGGRTAAARAHGGRGRGRANLRQTNGRPPSGHQQQRRRREPGEPGRWVPGRVATPAAAAAAAGAGRQPDGHPEQLPAAPVHGQPPGALLGGHAAAGAQLCQGARGERGGDQRGERRGEAGAQLRPLPERGPAGRAPAEPRPRLLGRSGGAGRGGQGAGAPSAGGGRRPRQRLRAVARALGWRVGGGPARHRARRLGGAGSDGGDGVQDSRGVLPAAASDPPAAPTRHPVEEPLLA
mmetsp:Transcript_7711/g.28423  ORF Transcript_7711/g.28423 Transcript_7711/m.28423 type:complete len:271 (+) Transcript_7711:466-1278(+)